MDARSLIGNWSWLPSRLALAMGFGALSAVGGPAQAATAPGPLAAGASPAGAETPDAGLRLRLHGGTVYYAEGGAGFRELPLDDTAEARRLKALLAADPAAASEAGTPVGRTILAGSGGAGFHWAPLRRDDSHGRRPAASGNRAAPPAAAPGAGGTPTPAPAGQGDGPVKKG